MDATPPNPPSRGSSPRRFAGALLGLLQGHIALFAEELKEQQTHTLSLLVLTSLSLLFGLLLLIGLFGAALFFGDAVITPAISVLSAVEGAGLVVPELVPWVVPITLGILIFGIPVPLPQIGIPIAEFR